MSTEQKEQEQNGNKHAAKFDAHIKKLVALIGGKGRLLPSKKVDADDLDTLVEELFAEERQKNFENAKVSLKELLEKYHQFQTELKAKRKELEKLNEAKMEDFNKAAQVLFDRLTGINEREQVYYRGLTQATDSGAENEIK
jgi:hypothetical protein